MTKLICKTCETKVDVVTKSNYVTVCGDIYCDNHCYSKRDLKDGLRKTKPPKTKKKKLTKWMCPNCNAKYSLMPRGAICTHCKSNPRLKSDADINLVDM